MSLLLLLAADSGDVAGVRQLALNMTSAAPTGTLEDVVNYQHPGPCSSGYNTGVTALMLAARSGHVEVVKALLALKANPNILDAELWNALHYAAFSGHADICTVLLAAKCNSNLITKFERATPLGFAQHRRFTRAVTALSPPTSKIKMLGRALGVGGHVGELGWTNKERHAALGKCIDKLQLSTPTTFGTIPFLFRYEVSMGGYHALERYLCNARDATVDESRLVLEALDNMLDGVPSHLKEIKATSTERRDGENPTYSNDSQLPNTPLRSSAITPLCVDSTATTSAMVTPNKKNYLAVTEDADIRIQCETRSKKRVLLIIHTDFEEHCRFVEKMRMMPDEGSVVRMSSINGLEHVVVVSPPHA